MCTYVSERSGIACQIKGEHPGQPHLAWNSRGHTILKRWY